MEPQAIIQLITRSTAQGAQKALDQCGSQPKAITKSQAYRTYGRSDTDRWLAEGLLKIQNNRLDNEELKRIAARSNRHTYLPAAAR
jgi:hypothetical protein